ncbi:hypothetical protein P8A22_18005 [Streptomyces laculatispora]|uniref:Serine/threonine protein kinase n=1 Tax=Streptomyces laculatispora TaxID=887464 RepID=A0ABY9I4K0_9ACTN|nr:hypothetical protein [Streptomyces laculatispora]WLQ41710.1 hypothetical protein P8A22_18005 [Streptomyces laculatispora]
MAAPLADAPAGETRVPDPGAVERRPRGRTALIIAAAAVLGITGGAAVGYGVQAGRAPTPPAALSQPGLAYPAKALAADRVPDPLPVAQDRRVRTDGDLRKLLVPRPAGWSENKDMGLVRDGWMGVEDYVLGFTNEDFMFGRLLEADVRRVAAAAWKKGEYGKAHVCLVQFGSGVNTSAADHAEDQRAYMSGDEDGAGNDGNAIKGSLSGRYYVYKAELKPGYMPLYRARAVFHRGDVMAEINLIDTRPISKKDIRTLAERQLERL